MKDIVSPTTMVCGANKITLHEKAMSAMESANMAVIPASIGYFKRIFLDSSNDTHIAKRIT